MLKVTNKDYEVEETIQLTKVVDGKEEVVYEFKMQLTEDDMLKIKHILFDYTGNNIMEYLRSSKEHQEELEKIAEEKIKENEEELIDICFKEHKDKFRELAGDYKFEDMVNEIRGYLMSFFMKKQISQMNTPITDLQKIMNNFQKLK